MSAAQPTTAAPPDQDARREALTNRQLGLIVEAGAGSGKTAILAGRVALLLADGVMPASIAAITFTELAAAELAARVREYVERLAAGEVPAELGAAFPAGAPTAAQRVSLTAALESIDELTCSTIHGFARELVRPYPVEANTDPGAGVLDAAQQQLMFRDVFEEWLREILGESTGGESEPTLIARLATLESGIGREALEELARFLHDRPDADSGPPADIAAVATTTAHHANSYYELVCGAPPEAAALVPGLEQLPQLIRDLLGSARQGEGTRCALSAATLERPDALFTQAGSLRKLRVKGKWVQSLREAGADKAEAEASYEEVLAAFDRFDEALARLAPAATDTLLHHVAAELREVSRRYQEKKRAAASLDFDDLITTALGLLRDHPAVRDELADRYRYVLIDEFQDTDPHQAEIVWRLTGEPNDDHWSTWPSRPGARFVVGDPKQSIYRFRGADIATYGLLTDLGAQHGRAKALSLNTNFRSRPHILTCVNESFAEPLAAPGQPGYVPLRPWHAPAAVPNVRMLSVPDPTGGQGKLSADDAREAEAETVATLVASLVAGTSDLFDQPLAPSQIALLAPVGSGLALFERALDQRGISVASQAGKGFYRRQEVQDLVALTRVLADPRDRLALGALLRGPLIGATDEELLDAAHALNHLEGDARFLSVTTDPHLLAPGPIRRSLERIGPLTRLRFATTPFALLGRAIDALEVRAVLEHRHGSHADRALANVERFLEHSRAFDTRGLAEFAHHVWGAWADSESELEGRADSASQAVTLITIHSAKGLEWPVVIPVNTTSRASGAKGVLYDRRSKTFAAQLLRQPCSNYESVKAAEDEEQALERIRLWYVAATRARELLIIPRHEGNTDQSAWCNMVAWRPDDIPVFAVTSGAARARTPERHAYTAQTRQQFVEEQDLIEQGLVSVERRAPSRREDQTLDMLATGEAPAAAAEPDVLTVAAAAAILESLDEVPEDPQGPQGVLAVGAARGILLHKIMEEIINDEVAPTADELAARAAVLAAQLQPLQSDAAVDPNEVAECALRAWRLPEVAGLHGRLEAEVEVAGVDESTPGSRVVWGGIADAVAVAADGSPDVVIDWKSDRYLSDDRIRHYQEQLSAYLHLTGAREGMLVLATTGQVIRISPD